MRTPEDRDQHVDPALGADPHAVAPGATPAAHQLVRELVGAALELAVGAASVRAETMATRIGGAGGLRADQLVQAARGRSRARSGSSSTSSVVALGGGRAIGSARQRASVSTRHRRAAASCSGRRRRCIRARLKQIAGVFEMAVQRAVALLAHDRARGRSAPTPSPGTAERLHGCAASVAGPTGRDVEAEKHLEDRRVALIAGRIERLDQLLERAAPGGSAPRAWSASRGPAARRTSDRPRGRLRIGRVLVKQPSSGLRVLVVATGHGYARARCPRTPV